MRFVYWFSLYHHVSYLLTHSTALLCTHQNMHAAFIHVHAHLWDLWIQIDHSCERRRQAWRFQWGWRRQAQSASEARRSAKVGTRWVRTSWKEYKHGIYKCEWTFVMLINSPANRGGAARRLFFGFNTASNNCERQIYNFSKSSRECMHEQNKQPPCGPAAIWYIYWVLSQLPQLTT